MVRENIPEYSVSEISNLIKNTLEDTFGYVKVRGEISGLKQAASGHVYFTLKDEKALIDAIIWRSNVSRLGFKPEDGLEAICSGKLTTGYSERYPGRSNYSIHIDSLKPAGEGALMALLEERKKKFLDVDWKGNNILLFGSEGFGMHKHTKKYADFLVRIDINKNIESLNISNSAAIVFHHLNYLKKNVD